MAVGFSNTNKPLNPRGQDASPKGYNRAKLFSGKALDFDGVNDSVEVGAEGGTYNDFTLVWNLKTSYTGNYQAVFSDGSLFDFYIKADGQFRAFIGTPNDTTSLPAINSGEWVNLVLTRSGSTGSFYYNGVLAETLTLPTSAMNNIDISIGQNKSSAYPFDGQIAGFKLFNTALTAAQVADLYNNPEKVVPTGVDNTALKLWLPMQEGAGTTAYDGSGNGNHGTISGATYVHGIGAPVSQTAVISWNKGNNNFTYSEDITQADWGASQATRDSNVSTAPDGQNTADKITPNTTNDFHNIRQTASVTNGQVYRFSTFLKADGYDYVLLNTPTGSSQGNAGPVVNLSNGTIADNYNYDYSASVTDAGNGWYKVEFDYTVNSSSARIDWNVFPTSTVAAYQGDGTKGVLIWGSSIRLASSGSTYVPTLSTAQTSPVLLPQGITTGRDITGVNLFENVRKQGALNLDGNSWAEVHDNGSLDITDEVTLECWLYHTDTTMLEHIIGKRASSGSWLRIYSATTNTLRVERDGGAATSNVSITENAWSHIVATIDTSDTIRFYVNGTQQTSKLNFTPWSLDNAAPVSIGAWVTEGGVPSSNSYANGSIAQPRIYNRALTAAEVLQNYNSGKNTYTNN